jgi:O-Antigen ligase
MTGALGRDNRKMHAAEPWAQVDHDGRGLVISRAAFRSALAVAAVAIFYTNFSAYLSLRTGGIVVHRDWLVLFLFAALLLRLGETPLVPSRIDPIHLWSYGYVIISLLWFYPFWQQTAIATRHFINIFLAVIFLVAMTIILSDAEVQRAARFAIAFAVVFAVGVNFYEFFHPLTFSRDIGRSAGLYLNSNPSAAALVIGMICAQDVVKPRYRLLFVLAAGLGVLLTLSRAGMIGWVTMVVLTSLRRGRRGRRLLELGLLVLLVVGFVFSPWWTELQLNLEQRGVLTADVRERLDFFSGRTSLDGSAVGREDAAREAWHMFVRDPLTGAGTGAFYEPPFEEIGPHNMYLALMVDYGFIGALVLPLLLLAVTWGAQGEAQTVAVPFVLFLAFWALFSHNVLEEPYILFALALVACMASTSQRARGGAPPAALVRDTA